MRLLQHHETVLKQFYIQLVAHFGDQAGQLRLTYKRASKAGSVSLARRTLFQVDERPALEGSSCGGVGTHGWEYACRG